MPTLSAIDKRITRWMAHHGVGALRVSVGIVFFWFGVLKFFPGMSPAQDLVMRTIALLSASSVDPQVALIFLAVWECLIGIGLVLGVALRVVVLLLLIQMLGTLTPLFLFPAETFYRFPYAPTLEGQYIIKNVVLISAALVIGATVRGGALVADSGDVAGRVGGGKKT
jgi:uncharacterized membrane protein YphA (DoxX/SURF4 family)